MNYAGLSECNVLNGIGFRTVLFVSGCNHRCYGCHNSKTWNSKYGHLYTEETKEYILKCLSKDYISGITLTGGDPLYDENLEDILYLVNEISLLFPEKTIWLYTGYTWEEIMNPVTTSDFNIERAKNIKTRQEIVSKCDVLVDGRYIHELRDLNLKFRGSSNQRVINIKESIKQGEIALWCD